ncbi:BMC domain-containing protein [Desulfobotulus mexicanus]|uniref:BMC domain-containing protein n=1 Tax=Desulfobotulus mexicanus TaxID=2586642 RepID=A0A5S5MEY4_9BACT|nr:BMC domain-containing protein [Desulfobotulus mexicanus]TYT74293.1 BMC domain-containing protein [Desulfobotulus mexicanus]
MDTLGIVEVKSIAAGVELADGMMKAADVELIRAATICSGRYMIYVAGERDAVASSVKLAEDSGRALAGSFIISNVSDQVLAVLKRGEMAEKGSALAVIECRNVSSGVAAADISVKRSAVRLVRMVTGQGINGKSYFVLSGDLASVEEATEAAKSALKKNLVEAVVIPNPDASVLKALTSVMR